MTHLRFVDSFDTGHRGGNTRGGVGVLALALGAVLLRAGPGLLPLRTGGLLDVHGGTGEVGHELAAGDGLHVQGLGQAAHDSGGEVVLAHGRPVLHVLDKSRHLPDDAHLLSQKVESFTFVAAHFQFKILY